MASAESERLCETCGKPLVRHSRHGHDRWAKRRFCDHWCATQNLEERFWSKVDKSRECWVWTACMQNDGYGSFWREGRMRPAHRVAYEMLIGPIADGLTLDHLCRNRACVNPGHLEPVTQGENVLRGLGVTAQNARKTHCIHGHEFTPANTRLIRRPHGRFDRRCRECHRAEDARASRLKKAAP